MESAAANLILASAGLVVGLTVTAIIVPFDLSSIRAANRASALIQVNERGGAVVHDPPNSNRARTTCGCSGCEFKTSGASDEIEGCGMATSLSRVMSRERPRAGQPARGLFFSRTKTHIKT
jgi:hypothetical protein